MRRYRSATVMVASSCRSRFTNAETGRHSFDRVWKLLTRISAGRVPPQCGWTESDRSRHHKHGCPVDSCVRL